ncbi:TetR/AcrR family transcriptional regulator [Gordonia sp. zg691]|uniref:TetR/AcrR family transcriptional regulator C-terminal domain-containing protein n=1 Tax=Gordonia jinghuaiqii TaxID=2758710 RepID=UPI0016625D09|nr:TetR/AcrR family transcriptional regulator C-terminal domain-containing protein [Gordonia jinghuaiqii]MBD0860236.1 TetR/AcrR family transcriptional regulator [Gordonia jinghuaiqii]
MSTADDARALVRLLWRAEVEAGGDAASPAAPRRGPRQRVTVDEIVGVAVDIADARGLAAVSMRALATELGMGPMSLYTYVPSRDVLVALMVDRVAADAPMPVRSTTVIDSLDGVARALRAEYLAHPWLLDASSWRQVLGPHRLRRYELQLEILEGLDISDLERDNIIALVSSFVTGNARDALSARSAVADSGLSDEQWWDVVGPELGSVMPTDAFPLSGRVGTAVGEHHQAPGAPDDAFEFGLARVLYGLRPLVGES